MPLAFFLRASDTAGRGCGRQGLKIKKKGIEENGKKKNYSGQLEDEYDAQ